MSQIEKIEKAIAELARRESEFETALIAAADAEGDYRLTKNMEFLKAEGTEKTRMAIAELATAELMRLKLSADAHRDALKAKVEDCRTVISARKMLLDVESRLTGQM